MNDIEVNRWKRYGHDRAYAVSVDGTKLGWMDLVTGAVTIEDGTDAAATTAALQAWKAEQLASDAKAPSSVASEPSADDAVPLEPTSSPLQAEVSPPLVSAEPPTRPPVAMEAPIELPPEPEAPEWLDLSLNRPGQAIRQQAVEEWEARKERSKFWAYSGRLLDAHTDERAWRVGAKGEEKVGPKLEKLVQKGWYVLHSVPVGKADSDIDHVLIGPGGVFTVNTKNHPGKKAWVGEHQIRINGAPVPYLRNSRHEAKRASALLTRATGFQVEATGVIVILTGGLQPNVDYKKKLPKDVLVCDAWDIPQVFKRRKGALTTEQVGAIYEVARRSTTWI